MSLRVSPFVPAVAGVACGLGATLSRGNTDAVIMWACAAFLCVVVSLVLLTRPKPVTPSMWCPVCEQRPGWHSLDGCCSDACLDRREAAAEAEAESLRQWRIHR